MSGRSILIAAAVKYREPPGYISEAAYYQTKGEASRRRWWADVAEVMGMLAGHWHGSSAGELMKPARLKMSRKW